MRSTSPAPTHAGPRADGDHEIRGLANVVRSSSGATINASLITGLSQPSEMAIYGNDLYVAEDNAGKVGEYGLDGSTINASLITGLTAPTALLIYPAPEPSAIALAGLGAVRVLAAAR